VSGEPDNRPLPKKEKIRPSYLWFLGGIGGVLIALFVLSVQWKDARKVARVVVEGATYFPEKDVRARAAVPEGALLDTISLGAIRKRLVSHPYIRDARVFRTYPDAVTISIEERVPVASFTVDGVIRYIDDEGVVLPYMESGAPYDLPGIAGIPELGRTRIGHAVEGEEYFEALGILSAALQTDSSVYRLISEVDMKNGAEVYLYSSENAVPIIFGHGDERRKFSMLRAFWDKFVKAEGPENLEYLDLRFSDQVVAKWHHKPQQSVNLSSM
jgi:cell division protein FtsQ